MTDKLRVKNLVLGPVATNVFIVYNYQSKECVVIDPSDSPVTIFKTINELGLKAKAILLTHGHFDHTTGAEELRHLLGVKIYASESEDEFLKDPYMNGSISMGGKKVSVTADILLRHNETLNFLDCTWTMISTPGHTPGSCCFYIADEAILFCGDTLFRDSYGRCDLVGGSESALVHSIVERLFILPDDVIAYPGHMETTTIGYEKVHNPIAAYYKNNK